MCRALYKMLRSRYGDQIEWSISCEMGRCVVLWKTTLIPRLSYKNQIEWPKLNGCVVLWTIVLTSRSCYGDQTEWHVSCETRRVCHALSGHTDYNNQTEWPRLCEIGCVCHASINLWSCIEQQDSIDENRLEDQGRTRWRVVDSEFWGSKLLLELRIFQKCEYPSSTY